MLGYEPDMKCGLISDGNRFSGLFCIKNSFSFYGLDSTDTGYELVVGARVWGILL